MMKGFFPLLPTLPPRRPTLPNTSYCTLTALEVGMALAKCSNLSAQGPDQIPYSVWKNVHRISGPLIASLLEPLLRWGIHPTTFKKSLGIVLPKPGKKDYSETTSYRIIALLPTLSKILERIVAMRLLPMAREKGLLHPNQCGSLPGLSTSDTVAALRHDVATAHRRGLKASSLMLDVKGGFDNVHPSLLAARLRRAGIPLSLRAWISSFLTDRMVALVFRGGPEGLSSSFYGYPPGVSLVSITFFNICFVLSQDQGKRFNVFLC